MRSHDLHTDPATVVDTPHKQWSVLIVHTVYVMLICILREVTEQVLLRWKACCWSPTHIAKCYYTLHTHHRTCSSWGTHFQVCCRLYICEQVFCRLHMHCRMC